MGESIKRGMIQNPAENPTGDSKESVIERGVIRTPKSNFDKRVDNPGLVTYHGPSKMESR